MSTQLTTEIANAINTAASQRLKVIAPATHREYVIVDAETFERLEEFEPIRNGIRPLERGEGPSLTGAMAEIHATLKNRT